MTALAGNWTVSYTDDCLELVAEDLGDTKAEWRRTVRSAQTGTCQNED